MKHTVSLPFFSFRICWLNHKAMQNPKVSTKFHKHKDKRQSLQFWFEEQKRTLLKFRGSGGNLLIFFLLLFLSFITLHNQMVLQQKLWGRGTSFPFCGIAISKWVVPNWWFFPSPFVFLLHGFGGSAITEEDSFWLENQKVKLSGLQSTSNITKRK